MVLLFFPFSPRTIGALIIFRRMLTCYSFRDKRLATLENLTLHDSTVIKKNYFELHAIFNVGSQRPCYVNHVQRRKLLSTTSRHRTSSVVAKILPRRLHLSLHISGSRIHILTKFQMEAFLRAR